jgi:hypothetical protein
VQLHHDVHHSRSFSTLQRIDIVILNAGLTRMALHIFTTIGHTELLQANYHGPKTESVCPRGRILRVIFLDSVLFPDASD